MLPNNRLSLAAPAKINLFLHVTGRRDDGYHLLESLVVFTETGDRLVVEPAKDLSLSIIGPFATGLPVAGPDNLVLRAAVALQREASIETGARLTLEKNLPVSSGIGGGSADAAAALRALSVLWGIDMSSSRLADIGLAIGADVPVCLQARPSIMSGVGETVRGVVPPPPCGVVLVNAGEGVSTPEVFRARTAPFSGSGTWETPRTFDAFVEALKHRQNDLSDPALSVSPVIGDVLAVLSETSHSALARLSGSGGTCFGLYPDAVAAGDAAAAIKRAHPDWWCVATTFRKDAPDIGPDTGTDIGPV
ncbi:MAG: 4-diphosphocytidyl-2-C-methyl-D-erythritol kinase [Paracoccaceae bacterium]|jgi:4-diphosphocytidyl-2-C-methyl-D-erythritol kinase